jgi:single-stranded-DNA-specific exonuclease
MIDWIVHPADERAVKSVSTSLLFTPLQARLLAVRGITSEREAEHFLEPVWEHLHDPLLFNEMELAAGMLHTAISSGDRILVHGDYDADGICGTALVHETLVRLGADAHFFIPDRAKDGYGLAKRVMERGVENGLKLVISVDCGSSDEQVVSYLRERGVKVIVTDHHETGERLREADAFLNPKLPGERYPFKELSGSGVAYKLLQGLERRMGIDLSLGQQIDLAALGTLGDYSPLSGENRAIVSLGMKEMRKWCRPGLRALRVESGLSSQGFTARKLCFTLIPRLNSPGRMGSARDVVKLLVTRDDGEAAALSRDIEEENRRRRFHDSNVTEEASYLADILLKRLEPNALVFSSSAWHEGVVGIGASRLAEKYNLPTVLIAVKNGMGKGSARSAGMVNIKEALDRCSDLLIEFGGHREAGGFSIEEVHIPDFQAIFEEIVGELIEKCGTGSVISADAEVSFAECDGELIAFIQRLAPFGPGNHEPLFLIRNIEVLPGTRLVGDGHLKLVGGDGLGTKRDLIAFSMGRAWSPERIIGSRIDVLTHVRNNVFMGREEVQLQVKAIRLAEEPLP